ncbi:hypothetical protein DSCA_62360 [Desulfosarcina alkanivorans]|uniref:4Fe-4S ferredoxin-type domain-containing protein n=1 Tax=Desulfosarcina alkanivorans TaxID=571177 RepID=A0A5K7YSI8_9BACT|nr:FAD-dependent oxidoreductase [Desulfosarcina alkanivorans]BBO72306.1 hypothetical protein DSCA_62360 [Desulfosarcina alkanivorans]
MNHLDPIDCILCRCHGEIDGIVDFDPLRRQLEADPRVRTVDVFDALCQGDAVEKLAWRVLCRKDRKVLIAACSVLARGGELVDGLCKHGIDPSRLMVADIREGCAWIHGDHPGQATRKAADIIRMGICALRNREVSGDVKIRVQPSVLVVGAGPAGLAAAAALGRAGVAVDLVEAGGHPGGMLNRLSRVAPGDRIPEKILAPLLETLQANPTIRVHTRTRVTDIRGSAGDFTVTLAGKDGDTRTRAGAVIVATGAKPVLPRGHYRYGRLPGVISGMALEKNLKDGLTENGNTVFIQCVDVRNEKRPYCSAVCCPAALKNAIRLKRTDPGAKVTILHRDIMSPGSLLEAEYRRATRAGVRFIRFDPEDPPRIQGDDRVTGVRVTDVLAGEERHLEAGRVVLSTPLEPRGKTDREDPVMNAIGLAVDTHGFYRVLPFLHTVETTAAGVFVCGAARWPVLVDGAMAQGKAAAAKALNLVAHAVRQASGLIGFQERRFGCARISQKTCSGCGNCVAVCPYDACALEQTKDGLRAAVNPVRCMGCGSCAAVCPNGSASLPEMSAKTMVRMIANAFAPETPAVPGGDVGAAGRPVDAGK